MPTYGRYDFADNAEVMRKAGSDALKDKKGKWRKLRTWNASEGRWRLSLAGEAYYGEDGQELVVSVPVHMMILRKDGTEQSYRGYLPVSHLRSALKDRGRPREARRGESARHDCH